MGSDMHYYGEMLDRAELSKRRHSSKLLEDSVISITEEFKKLKHGDNHECVLSAYELVCDSIMASRLEIKAIQRG